jgi:hypothetical protein
LSGSFISKLLQDSLPCPVGFVDRGHGDVLTQVSVIVLQDGDLKRNQDPDGLLVQAVHRAAFGNSKNLSSLSMASPAGRSLCTSCRALTKSPPARRPVERTVGASDTRMHRPVCRLSWSTIVADQGFVVAIGDKSIVAVAEDGVAGMAKQDVAIVNVVGGSVRGHLNAGYARDRLFACWSPPLSRQIDCKSIDSKN